MTPSPVEIGVAQGSVDTSRVVQTIRETVERKLREGAYFDPRIARAERMNLSRLAAEEDFFEFYMDCLREAILVDINDFEIRERRKAMGFFSIALKRLIWKMLKFYTYRLWSQQNQANALLLASLEEINRQYCDKIRKLENRIAALEAHRQTPS